MAHSSNMSEEMLSKHFQDFDAFLAASKYVFNERMGAVVKFNARVTDFQRIRTLASGNYGRVMLVKQSETKEVYAMKILEKAHIVKYNQVQHTKDEITLLSRMEFEFIVRLYSFFEDNVYLYFTMPFVNGGELFTHLRLKGRFDEDLSKFYASQVILALEYLHFLGIVYRDLKPENLLLDSEGYIKVTDFGFCKKIDEQRTKTFCCTSEYAAPESIRGQGYNYTVDWWALGVLIFEMAAGYSPFRSPDQDKFKIFMKILAGKYDTPNHFSEPLKRIVASLLQVDCTKRIGNLENGAKDIKAHEWFKTLDWNAVWRKEVKPSYVPETSSLDDVQYFEEQEEQDLRMRSIEEFPEEFKDLGK